MSKFEQHRALLQSDREAFIRLCPSLGIAKSIARYAFGSPRHVDACAWIFSEVARQWMHPGYDGVREPVMQIAQYSENRWPLPATAAAVDFVNASGQEAWVTL